MTISPWDAPGMREKLAELWPNHSASQIVEIMGFSTRCGVIGAANRMGLPPKGRGYNQYGGNGFGRVWNEDRLATAKQGFEQGLTLAVIAQDCGLSPQSVSTMAKRQGWKRPPPQPRPARVKRERPPLKQIAKPAMLMLGGHVQVCHGTEARTLRVKLDNRLWRALPGITPVTLMDVGRLECRWPIDTEMCCGAPVEVGGKPYCATHRTWSVQRKKDTTTT